MLTAYKEHEGVSLLGGTGVTETDILQVIPVFSTWMETNKDTNILDFFTEDKVPVNVVKALAVIGFKCVINELNIIATYQEKEEK